MKSLLTAVFVILLATEVQAQCFKAKTFEAMAKEKWREQVSNIAVTQDGRQLRVYNNPETGSWTITIVHPNGRECAMSAGDGWRDLPKGDPA